MKLSGDNFKHIFESIDFFGISQANGSPYHFENLAPKLAESFCPQIMFVETRNINRIVVFIIIGHNVFAVCFGRFETVVYRNATNKDTMFTDFCKAKIIVFREGTTFANALYLRPH